MKRKKQNILEQKEAELISLNAKSDSAIRLVRATIDGLDKTNVEIQSKIEEIDAIQKRFADARDGLEATYSKNQKIAQNFKALLCVE